MRGSGGAGGLFVAGLCAVGGGDTVRGCVLSEGGLWAGFGSRHAGWFQAGGARASGVACGPVSGFVMPRASGPCIFGLHLRLGGAFRRFFGCFADFAGVSRVLWLFRGRNFGKMAD